MKSVQHSDLKRVKQIAMNGYYSVLTTIDLFVLSFMGLLTRLSESLNKKQKRGFFLAFALIAGISVMEIVTLAVDGAPAKYRWLNIASNFLGFGLSPAVAICLVYVQDRKSAPRQKLRFAVGCEIAYLLFLAFSIPFGTVFSVSADNVYSRGTHFHIYIVVYFAAIFYLSLATILTARAFQNRSRALIYPLMVFLTAETIVQVALPDLHVTWLCVTLLAVLYYIYCTEMWNQLDALTGLLNQSSYLHRTAEMTRRGGMLVVFDVDHFKHINDRYGHLQGGCVPCGNCGLHKKSLCLLRLLLPNWRRRILRAAKRRAVGSSLRPGIPAVPGGTAADNRLLAHGLLWRRCAFGREHGEGQGAGGPPNVSLQKKELSPPLPPPKSAMRQNPAHAGDFTQFPIHYSK